MNYNININLQSLKNTAILDLKGRKGVTQCLVIPVADNDLFVGEKGVYLNLVAWENSKLSGGKTHLIKQSFTKKVSEAMTVEERRNQPVMGDAKPFEFSTVMQQSAGTIDLQKEFEQEIDDLPF
jgi:hypothetical protein